MFFHVAAGLVENLIEHVKQTHVKLNMSSLQVGKPILSKGKDEPIIQELAMTFDLLRNFMYQCEEVKVSLNFLFNVPSDQGLQCLLTGLLIKNTIKATK